MENDWADISRNNFPLGVWVPAFAGTTLECWARAFVTTGTEGPSSQASAFPRRVASELCFISSRSSNKGRREGRALAAPVARLRKRMQAAGTTGLAENARPSPRDGFNGCFAVSPVRRAFWPPLPARRWKRRRKRDTSVGVSGPCDLTVRASLFVGANDHAATTHAHRIPLPTSVTTAIRPLRRNGTSGRVMLILRSRQAEYFSAQGWTGFAQTT
ncbi:conserved protein of unknown function [Bradyrhizobium sp. ORS 285]|nr:conserved protein of unknown function [Bradyrhizobium sp. ORS 285]